MKVKYLFLGMVVTMLSISSCQKPDELVRTETENVTGLTIRGCLTTDQATDYPAIVDNDNKTITIEVPYYTSETQPIQGDLTSMKIVASTLPVGSYFQPSLAGIHNMVEGFKSTLVGEDGSRIEYTINAVYKKSGAANITKVTLTDGTPATIVVVNPDTVGKEGKVVIYKTSSSLDASLKSATLDLSPWSTVTSSALNSATGIIDLSVLPDIVVKAQNGTDSIVYKTSIELPTLLPSGIGYINVLFGKQFYTDNTEGWEAGANRTMAIVDDYLIVSNSNDFTKMLVFNRFSGARETAVTINTDAIYAEDPNHIIMAIANDEANHLVAMTYVSNGGSGVTTSNQNVRLWVWNNGITSAPASKVWANIGGGTFTNNPRGINGVNAIDLGRTMCIKGDMTSGNAVVATMSMQVPRPVFMFFVNGAMQGTAYAEWGGGSQVSMWKTTKIIPLTTQKPLGYIWSTANFRSTVTYVPEGTGGSRGISFTAPSSHWWKGSGTYDHNVRAIGYTEFNGCHLLAVQNGWSSGGVWYHRMYVSDISANPGASSLGGGFIFDTREGNVNGTSGITGTGYSISGMTSSYPFESGKTILGPNTDETGDIIFGKSADGNAVQVYMLTTDNGLFAYELTRFDL